MNHPKSKRKKSSHKGKSTTHPNTELTRTPYRTQIRWAKIHQMLFEQQEHDNGVRPWITTERIAEELGDSMRTISEAIARMRVDLELPVHYVEKRKGIGYTEKVTSLPTMVCTQSESMGLCVSMLGMSIHAGTPYAAGARSIAKKLTAGLCKELSVEFEALEKAVSFHCIGADAFIPPVNFEVTTPAIIYRQELEIEYVKAYGEPTRDGAKDAESGLRRVEPLHLACIDFGWYLFAWDPKREGIRTFALRRIRQIRMTGTTCKPRRFNVHKELDDCFGPFHGRKAENIRLRFWGRAGGVIPEFLWHRSQKIEPVPDSSEAIDVTMRVSINPRLVGWICDWLGEVAVLEPKSLRDQVSEAAKKGHADQERIGAEWDARKAGIRNREQEATKPGAGF
jgi:predicted DNA-binding transcriptional regulator YafY